MNFNSILNDLLDIPKTLLKSLNYYISEEGLLKLKRLSNLIDSNKIDHILFLGHSYNYFASIVSLYYIDSKLRYGNHFRRIKSLSQEIDEFLTYLNPEKVNKNTLYVLISKSGESIQIKQAIDFLIKCNLPIDNIICVTSNINSYIGLKVNKLNVFPFFSENEEVVGSKSYINELLCLYLISRAIVEKNIIPDYVEEEIRQLIFEIKFYGSDWEFHTREFVNFLGQDFDFLYFISKGASLSTAYQAAQTCLSYTKTYAEGISIGLFLHGPFQIVDNKFRCILIIGDETSIEETLELMNLITKKIGTGKVILINNSRELSSLGRANPNVYVFEHTTKDSYLAPIFEIVVIQYLLLNQAKRKGIVF